MPVILLPAVPARIVLQARHFTAYFSLLQHPQSAGQWFRTRFSPPLRQTGKGAARRQTQGRRLLTRMLMLGVKMAFPSRAIVCFMRFISAGFICCSIRACTSTGSFSSVWQVITTAACAALAFNVAGNQLTFRCFLPDISISSRFQDFPVVDISLRSQCDRVTHFRISVFS